jgi:hypothetical protein
MVNGSRLFALMLLGLLAAPRLSLAQDPVVAQPAPVHEHVDVTEALLTPTRDATGTAWLPVATPMYGLHQPWKGWDARISASVFGQVLYEPTERHRTGGADSVQISSMNWGMAMLRRRLGDGRIGLRGMLSAEPWTNSDCGSLNLLATGEVCEGDTIHDRQQPHDFVMELSAEYERALSRTWRWQLYAGLAGEPALGPPGFAHRASAALNPTAPVSHHLIDPPTSYGVITIGVHNSRWKVEASAFNGRAADDNRVDLDFGSLDSTAARVSFLVTDRWAFQASAARMHEVTSVFSDDRDAPISKLNASATYHRPVRQSGLWATTIAYAIAAGPQLIIGLPFDIVSDGLLVESTFTPNERHSIFGRTEIMALPAHHVHAHELLDAVLSTGKVQIGYVRQLAARRGLVAGFGLSGSLALLPTELAPRYEGRTSAGLTVFFSLRPARHQM